jgi:hypothetical protein
VHELSALGPVGFSVGVDQPLVDAPGGLDLDVVIDAEESCQPSPLPVGEEVGAGVQGPPRPVERVVFAAAVTVEVLLDAAAAPVQD